MIPKNCLKPTRHWSALLQSIVFHSMLTDAQDEELEKLQATALRHIYGYGISYAKVLEESSLDTLR